MPTGVAPADGVSVAGVSVAGVSVAGVSGVASAGVAGVDGVSSPAYKTCCICTVCHVVCILLFEAVSAALGELILLQFGDLYTLAQRFKP